MVASAGKSYVGRVSGRRLDEPFVDYHISIDKENDSIVPSDCESVVTLRNVDPPHPVYREIVRARVACSAGAASADVEIEEADAAVAHHHRIASDIRVAVIRSPPMVRGDVRKAIGIRQVFPGNPRHGAAAALEVIQPDISKAPREKHFGRVSGGRLYE